MATRHPVRLAAAASLVLAAVLSAGPAWAAGYGLDDETPYDTDTTYDEGAKGPYDEGDPYDADADPGEEEKPSPVTTQQVAGTTAGTTTAAESVTPPTSDPAVAGVQAQAPAPVDPAPAPMTTPAAAQELPRTGAATDTAELALAGAGLVAVGTLIRTARRRSVPATR